MGTRRRDAERRQVSLAVEALEDRFLLSSATPLPAPTATNAPPAPPATAPVRAAGYEAVASPQTLPAQPPAWQATAFPFNSMMSYQRDNDGDADSLDPTDGRASDNPVLALPLPCSSGSGAECCLEFVLAAGAAVQLSVPNASLVSFLPLVSAAGFGVTSMAPLPLTLLASAASDTAPGNVVPSPGTEELRPSPADPETPLPPLIEEPAKPLLPSLPAGQLAELLSIDLEAIQRGVDAFFQQLGNLSEEWRGGQILEKLAPWLLTASIAGYGWIRFREFRRPAAISDLACLPGGLRDASIFLARKEE